MAASDVFTVAACSVPPILSSRAESPRPAHPSHPPIRASISGANVITFVFEQFNSGRSSILQRVLVTAFDVRAKCLSSVRMTSVPSIATMAVFLGCLLLLLHEAEGKHGKVIINTCFSQLNGNGQLRFSIFFSIVHFLTMFKTLLS